MGTLLTGTIDFNDSKTIDMVRAAIAEIVADSNSYFPLEFKPSFYFYVPGSRLTSQPGWYVILNGRKSLYVGKAGNLKNRLSSNQGSVDQFAKKTRSSEPERNFIKKFIELGIIANPRVCIVEVRDLADRMGLKPDDITPLDIANIEKFLNIFRHELDYV